ncbi:MAG: methionyl-tRNA formyltransferase [Lachnospiraceae bacterium]|nr:methionyl-tRNA formyltransferase [Lachnospiraceae bacterium]
MKIVYFGTPDFAVKPLQALIEKGHEVCAVVTREDKPRGRGYELFPTPVKEEALKYSIPVIHPVKLKDEQFLNQLKQFGADCFVVVAYGRILPKVLLDIPRYGCINVHGSLLPSYRGAAPIQWAVIDGLKESGVTTMLMDEGLDTGDILRQYRIPINPDETGGSLFDKLADLGGLALIDTLQGLEDGTISPVKQGETDTEYARMLTKADGKIDFNDSAVKIERLVRGLNPWPSAYTTLNGKTLKIWKARVSETGDDDNPLCFKTGDGYLYATEVQLEGKKRMDAATFLLGYKH